MSPHRSNISLNDLLAVVDRLTTEHLSTFTVEIDNETVTKTVRHEPLLQQLRNSVLSSIGARPHSGGLASERSVIDSDALEQYHNVQESIIDLYKTVTDALPFETPEKTLRQWYIEFSNRARSGKVSHDVVHKTYVKLSKIAKGIENKLNPPTILEITSPCPRCGIAYGKDQYGVYRHAVIVESRVSDSRSLEHTKARCVACNSVWVHARGMRQLRWEIDEAEANVSKQDTVEHLYDVSGTIEGAGVQPRPFSDGVTA